MSQSVKKTLQEVIDFLEEKQTESGGFRSLSAADPETFVDAHVFPSVFSTTLILSCLNDVQERLRGGDLDEDLMESVRALRARTRDFLLSQKSDHWTWNYWVRESDEYEGIPYPDDLDDTFCALAALAEYQALSDDKIIDGAAMAQIVKVLTAYEVAEGGPYRTWIVGDDAKEVWKDIDPIVNANIAYFLALQELELAPLTTYLLERIEQEEFQSPYYPSLAPRLFLGLRALRQMAVVLEADITQSEEAAEDEARLARVQAAVQQLEQELRQIETDEQLGKAIQAWLDSDLVDLDELSGPWQPGVIYTGVNPAYDRRFYAGSAAVTAAFCLQAVGRFHDTSHTPDPAHEADTEPSPAERALQTLSQTVTARLEQEMDELPAPLPARARAQLDAMLESNSHHIILTPAYIAHSTGRAEELESELLVQLGQTSLLGWIAYTIFDDFLDEEGDPEALPVATWALRRFVRIFRSCLSDSVQQAAFSQLVDEVITTMDAANTWEVSETRVTVEERRGDLGVELGDDGGGGSELGDDRGGERYLELERVKLPEYRDLERLSHRSLGHALAPLAVLLELGFAVESAEVAALREYFHHYLIARQLNDDAHDWRADLRQGHLNAVTVMILQDEAFADSDLSSMPLSELIPQMEKVFWKRTIEEVHAAVVEHATAAKQIIADTELFVDEEVFAKFLLSAERGMAQAVRERDTAQEFLEVYRGE